MMSRTWRRARPGGRPSPAFAGTLAGANLVELIVTQWLVKVLYETAATPLTYAVVTYVKRREGVDTYDRQVSLNPLSFLR